MFSHFRQLDTYFKNTLRLLLIIILVLPFQSGHAALAEFLTISGSARQDAAGGSFSAIPMHADGVGTNPASVEQFTDLHGFFTYAPFFHGVNYFKGYIGDRFKYGSFGIQFTSWDSGSIESTEVDSNGNISKTGKKFGFSGQAFGLTYANSFFWGVSTGATLKLIREDLATLTYNTVGIDLGAQKQILKNRLMFGVSVLNSGPAQTGRR